MLLHALLLLPLLLLAVPRRSPPFKSEVVGLGESDDDDGVEVE